MTHRRNRILSCSAVALLTLLLVFLSSGVSFMRCAHSGNVMLAQLSAWSTGSTTMSMGDFPTSCNESADSHKTAHVAEVDEPDCMNVVQWSLPTLQSSHHPAFDFHVLQPLLATDHTLSLLAVLPEAISLQALPSTQMWHAPPRTRLQMFCTLLI